MSAASSLMANRRKALAIAIALSLLAAVVGLRVATRPSDEGRVGADDGRVEAGEGATGQTDGAGGPTGEATGLAGGSGAGGGAGSAGGVGGTAGGAGAVGGGGVGGGGGGIPGTRTPLPGVTDKEITLVYYWKGDRTRTSPYLAGSGVEGNVDEAEAFRKLVDFVNANDGKGTLMGQPINLHGRRLKGVVVEAGQNAEDYAAAATGIAKELKPFAAVAAHGSVSAYMCPTLAKAGIHNVATYDLAGRLAASTNGYCLPSGLPWDQQVDVTEGWLLRQQRAEPHRVYGVVYAEYPGLVDSAPKMVERYRKAGIKVAEVAAMSDSLTTAQQQASNVVGRMVQAGVNTIVMPDAGAPLNFTHAAQAQGYNPDYYIWPCSGQDTMGMVRLFNPAQWARAEGLTCYDQSFTSDLAINDQMRGTEWYRAYQSAAPGREPPAPTPFVYAALLPVVAGVANAGRDLTLETFRAGLDRFTPYRYDAVGGRAGATEKNLLLGLGSPDRRTIADAVRLKYNPARRERGSSTPGSYDFPESRRYAARADFTV